MMYDKIKKHVEAHADEYMSYVRELYEHPETGNEEFASMKLLAAALRRHGFETQEAYVCPTGFIGSYHGTKKGPVIAYLCEYDALPEVGHGCGHNLIAATSLAAGAALKAVIDEIGGEVRVIGTPAEENFGGKVTMSDAHVFDDVDVAMMLHPSTEDRLGAKELALYPLKFEFFGTNAHACQPQNSHSALDAAVMSYMGISLLRQYTKANTYIHGIIRDGGQAANVIPAYASMEYYFRGESMAYVNELCKRAEDCVKGACEASGCTYQTSVYECPYEDNLINYTLCDLLKEEFEKVGRSNVLPVNEIPAGSSDIGSVSYVCPTLHGNIKIADEHVNGHSREMAQATISKQGEKALREGAVMLASLGARLITERETLEKVKREFTASKAK